MSQRFDSETDATREMLVELQASLRAWTERHIALLVAKRRWSDIATIVDLARRVGL